jgi:hypothetical protein
MDFNKNTKHGLVFKNQAMFCVLVKDQAMFCVLVKDQAMFCVLVKDQAMFCAFPASVYSSVLGCLCLLDTLPLISHSVKCLIDNTDICYTQGSSNVI